jgi:hypothetical protein
MLSWRAPRRHGISGYLIYLSTVDPAAMQGFRIETRADPGAPDAPVRAGDLAIVRAVLSSPDRGALISDRMWHTGAARRLRPLSPPGWPTETPGAQWQLIAHPADPTRLWGGRSHLRATLAPGAGFVLGGADPSGVAGAPFRTLRPGEYALSVRLRGDRPGRALARIVGPNGPLGPAVTLDYGPGWRRTEARITIGGAMDAWPLGRFELALSGPAAGEALAQVDLDELRLHHADEPWLDYDALDYARLRSDRVRTLRTHGLVKTGRETYDLVSLLSEGGFVDRLRRAPGLPAVLAMMQKSGTAPWLQIEPHLSDAEWLGLIEWLAAPFDPATDDPAALPWAALRVAQGRTRPWTEAFDPIWLELGNETWNGLMRPWVFPALRDAADGSKAAPSQVYGLFQARIAAVLRTSPWWGSAGLEQKLRFVIGGRNRFPYGEQAAIAAGPQAADMLAVAGYNGGWDEGEGPPARSEASYFNVLNHISQATIPTGAALIAEAARIGAARGAPLLVGTYEAGPGYAMDGLNGETVTPDQARAQEEVMKSRTAGAATLDAFLARSLAGFAEQTFFTFGEGLRWTSHAPRAHGGAAYPSWALLGLMNREIRGAFLEVETLAVPRADLAASKRRIAVAGAPLVAVYATRAPGRMTVTAISRRAPGDPGDAEARCTPFEISLPVRSAARLIVHRTGGAPQDHGVDGAPPPIETRALSPAALADGMLRAGPATGTPACGLPPASAYVWVLEDPA